MDIFDWRMFLVCGAVMLNPLFWNTVSRLEYKTRAVSRVLGGPKRGVVALAGGIVSLNYVRTSVFNNAVDAHGSWALLDHEVFVLLGTILVVLGAVFVIASSWRLGFYCSFMGDYFGILLNERVTGFPFNVVDDPMYWGSTLIYLGLALRHASLVGVVLTACIGVSYAVGIYFEEPFTAKIYAEHKSFDQRKNS